MKINRKHMSDSLYTVRDIIDIKDVGGVEHCLVWWEGYPKSQATWEPTENMTFLSQWKQYYENLKSKYSHENDSLPLESPRPLSTSKRRDPIIFQTTPKTPQKKTMMSLPKQSVEKGPHQKEYQILKQSQEILYQESSLHRNNKIRNSDKKVSKREIMNIVDSSEERETKKKKIKKQNKYEVILRGKRVELQPMKVDLQITESRDLPFSDQELVAIRSSFIKNGEMMYEVQFEGRSLQQPIILHNKYLKLLWPKKLAEYLLSKIKTK